MSGGGNDADAPDREALGGEEDGNETPDERVVEVVDQAGLADRRKRGIAHGRGDEGVAERLFGGVLLVMQPGLLARVVAGLAHEPDREHEPGRGDADAEDEGPGSRSI